MAPLGIMWFHPVISRGEKAPDTVAAIKQQIRNWAILYAGCRADSFNVRIFQHNWCVYCEVLQYTHSFALDGGGGGIYRVMLKHVHD